MVTGSIYRDICSRKESKRSGFAVLIDPDKLAFDGISELVDLCADAGVNYFFVGGSLLTEHQVGACVLKIRERTDIPVILFPGSALQITSHANALLYLSLISGRNPELLIGQHVVSAPLVRASGLEVMATGYMVIDGGVPTTVSYMSGSAPIPADKPDIALCTAWAAELQGKHLIYMDSGSGAKNPVSTAMIQKVSSNINIPLIVGGGIRTADQVSATCKAGADIVVVGNAIEKDPQLVRQLVQAARSSCMSDIAG